jgi:hypothetical protein
MKITIYWDMSIFTVEVSSTLKKDAAGSPKGQEISTKLLYVTPQKMIIFNREYPLLKKKKLLSKDTALNLIPKQHSSN